MVLRQSIKVPHIALFASNFKVVPLSMINIIKTKPYRLIVLEIKGNWKGKFPVFNFVFDFLEKAANPKLDRRFQYIGYSNDGLTLGGNRLNSEAIKSLSKFLKEPVEMEDVVILNMSNCRKENILLPAGYSNFSDYESASALW